MEGVFFSYGVCPSDSVGVLRKGFSAFSKLRYVPLIPQVKIGWFLGILQRGQVQMGATIFRWGVDPPYTPLVVTVNRYDFPRKYSPLIP